MQYFVYMMASDRCSRLVYIEQQQDRISAQARELELKGWKRYRKLALIDAVNPEWKDLSALWPAMLR